MEMIQRRGGLPRFMRALDAGKVTIGFIGGSITEAANESNWPEFIRSWFVQRFPDKRLWLENAAIGGTSSFSGLMRADRDLVERGCDLVFVEYAVNDSTEPVELCRRPREGLLRKLLKNGIDTVIVYTFNQPMYKDMAAGKVPWLIAEFEQLAERYGIPSVWMGLNAYNAVRSGRISWDMWLPVAGGSIHPDYAGSMLYAEPVIEFLESELADPSAPPKKGGDIAAPLYPDNYESMRRIGWDSVGLSGPWVFMREVFSPWFDHVLYSAADGASLTVRFTGRIFGAMMNFGKCSAVLDVRVDGGAPTEFAGVREYWVPDRNWTAPALLAEGLAPGEHTAEIRIKHGDRGECGGTVCKIFAFYAAE